MRKRIAAALLAIAAVVGIGLASASPAQADFDGYVHTETPVYVRLSFGPILIGTVDFYMGWSTTGGCHVLQDGGPGHADGIRVVNNTSWTIRLTTLVYSREIDPPGGGTKTIGYKLNMPNTLQPGEIKVYSATANWVGSSPMTGVACDQIPFMYTAGYAPIETGGGGQGDNPAFYLRNYSPTGWNSTH